MYLKTVWENSNRCWVLPRTATVADFPEDWGNVSAHCVGVGKRSPGLRGRPRWPFQLAPLYPDPRHERRLVQWLLRARGTVRWDSDHLEITLERPARPRWAQAIAALLMETNAQDPRYPRYPADPRYSIQFTLRAARKM